MADFIDNVAAADSYTKALEIGPNFRAKGCTITVANNPAKMQFAVGKLGHWRWTDEREYLAIPQSFYVGNVLGVKFRNANAGQVARIIAILSTPDDPDFGAGQPFTGILSATGGLGGSVNINTLAQWPPSGPIQNDYAVLADTYDGIAFADLYQYRPDLNATYPWDAVDAGWRERGMANGTKSDNLPTAGAYGDVLVAGSGANFKFLAMRDGQYEFKFRTDGQADVGGNFDVGAAVGATNPANPITFAELGPNYVAHVGSDTLTMVAGDDARLRGKFSNAAAGFDRLVATTCLLRPLRIK